ncbi:hypothetical protein TRP8649_03511 [Pelagimonas phthalicica]|uniref:Uncharacterized protein n=1 Tax=Pelagimonas phthalicica TaxID=1037362 RepID=A0A238JGW0_9RHOB|nr:hypothetical protein [Pelagimonas phthalicica]TDS92316.1 hypothetical protein CLV87_3508 [Pelagimonas phthalicica]SMX29377.1 hypothetical protein TRP8649_03511 [Pelagimonas phthalicica]
MTDSKKTAPDGDFELDSFFAAARAEEPLPSGDFMARIEADALAALPSPAAVTRPGLWQQFLQSVGGWPGAAGLAAACATGVWIGVAPPDALYDLWAQTAGLGGVEIDPTSGFDLAMMEG